MKLAHEAEQEMKWELLGHCSRTKDLAMNLMTERPFAGEPLVTPTTYRARLRAEAFLMAIDVMLDTNSPCENGLLSQCYVAPCAQFVMVATCCDRPLLYREGELIGDATGHDVILLRFDADRGTSFDILRCGSKQWLCRYLTWRRVDGDLWLIPPAGNAPYIRVCASGLEQVETAPFADADEQLNGVILAINNPSFEGSF